MEKEKRNNLPTSWKEVSLSEFKQLVGILPSITQELDLNKEIEIALKVFNILGFSEYNQLDIDELMEKLSEVSFVFQTPPVLNLNQINIDGINYGFNTEHFWSVVEFVQLSDFMTDKQSEDIIEHIEDLIAIFLRPIDSKIEKVITPVKVKIFGKELIFNKKKYKTVNTIKPLDVNELEQRSLLFKEKLSADVAYSLYVFFYLLITELSIANLQSLVVEQMMELKQI
jgi:hypothetical protein